MRTISDNSTSSLWWSLLNTAGGFFLFLKSPFRIGDFIELGGKIGSVTKKSFFGSDIETVDGKSVHLDHRYFLFEKLNNLSNQNIIRLDLSINICYSEDMGKVKTDINNFLDTQPSILKSPKPKITVVKLHQNYVE